MSEEEQIKQLKLLMMSNNLSDIGKDRLTNYINNLENQLQAYKDREAKLREYCNNKIKKSFNYDYGIDNSKQSDRLFTETVTELQLILQILNENIEK